MLHIFWEFLREIIIGGGRKLGKLQHFDALFFTHINGPETGANITLTVTFRLGLQSVLSTATCQIALNSAVVLR